MQENGEAAKYLNLLDTVIPARLKKVEPSHLQIEQSIKESAHREIA